MSNASEFDQMLELLEASGVALEDLAVSSGGKTGPSVTLVPNQVCPFAVYSGGLTSDKAKWAATPGLQGGIFTDSITLISAQFTVKTVGGEQNADGPNPELYNHFEATLALGSNTVIGTIVDGELVEHKANKVIAAASKVIDVGISVNVDGALDKLQHLFIRNGFTLGDGTNIYKKGQDRKWAFEAANSGNERTAFAEKIANGIKVLSVDIGANSQANDEARFTSRDFLTNIQRTVMRLGAAHNFGAKTSPEEATAHRAKVRRLGQLAGSNRGPIYYPENAPFAEYSESMGIYRLTVTGQMGGPETIELRKSGINTTV